MTAPTKKKENPKETLQAEDATELERQSEVCLPVVEWLDMTGLDKFPPEFVNLLNLPALAGATAQLGATQHTDLPAQAKLYTAFKERCNDAIQYVQKVAVQDLRHQPQDQRYNLIELCVRMCKQLRSIVSRVMRQDRLAILELMPLIEGDYDNLVRRLGVLMAFESQSWMEAFETYMRQPSSLITPGVPVQLEAHAFTILCNLADSPTRLVQAELQECASPSMTRRTVSRHLKRLTTLGFVDYNPSDKKGASITQAGKAYLENKP